MGKEITTSHSSCRSWLCTSAMLALVCVAFVVGLLLGPIVSRRGEHENGCKPNIDGTSIFEAAGREPDQRPTCISQKELLAIFQNWSLSADHAIEEKLLNVTKWKINHAVRKFSKAKEISNRKTIQEIKNAILVNWTAQLSQLVNDLFIETPVEFQVNVTRIVIEEIERTATREPDVIQVDTLGPITPANPTNFPVAVALYPLNGKYSTWDVSGRGNPNGIARGVRLAPGPNGRLDGSYQFSGSCRSFIQLPNTGPLNAQDSITILLWVYVHTRLGSILSYNPLGLGVSLGVNPQRELFVTFVSSDYSQLGHMTSKKPLKNRAWSYVGASYDHASGVATLWVNGHVSRKRRIGAMTQLSTDGNVRLGASATDDGSFFNGRITQLQVYDRALSQREVEAVRGPIQAGVCPQGWTGYHFSCYLLFNRLTSQWNQARQVCQQHGADLVKIETPEENHAVYRLAQSKATSYSYMWIGLLRGSPAEQFSWVDDPSPTLYSNWATGEPNDDLSRGENCGHMYINKGLRATQWNDELCVNPTIGPMIFMCEKIAVEPRSNLGGTRPAQSGNYDDEESGEGSGSGDVSGDTEYGENSCTYFGME